MVLFDLYNILFDPEEDIVKTAIYIHVCTFKGVQNAKCLNIVVLLWYTHLLNFMDDGFSQNAL